MKKLNKITVIKEFEDDKNINSLISSLDDDKNSILENQLEKMKQKNLWERVVNFELMNCYFDDIFMLHNIHILNNRFGFLVVSNNFICLIECVQAEMNVTINELGDIYQDETIINNPFTECRNKLDIIKEKLIKEKIVDKFNGNFLIIKNECIITRCTAPEFILKNLIDSNDLIDKISEFKKINKKIYNDKEVSSIIEFLLKNNNESVNSYDVFKDQTPFEFGVNTAKDCFNSTLGQIKKLTSKKSDGK